MAYESWKFRVAWQSHPDDPAPIWTDETSRVDGEIVVTEAREDYGTDVQPSQLIAALRNHDQRFTPGNWQSPLWPNVKPKRRCQVTDLVGSEEVSVFDGNIELPEITQWQKSDEDAPRDQTITITAVDRMGRQDRARRFASTLAAHIEANGDGTLSAYWLLADSGHPIRARVGGRRLHAERSTSTQVPVSGAAQILFNQGAGPRADDVTPLALTSATDGAVTTLEYLALSINPSGVSTELWSLEAGQTITIVVWVHPDWTRDESVTVISLLTDDGLVDLSRLSTSSGTAPGQWRVSKPVGDLTGNVASDDQAASFTAYPIAIQFGYDPNTLELWVAEDQNVATLSGTLSPTPLAIRDVTLRMYEGSLSHLQVYVGDPDAFTFADFTAQLAVGREGLAGQRVDERIETIAGYSGVPADSLDLDKASAIMPVALLAGRRPGDVLRDAAATDNGQMVTSNGNLAFLGRARRYNPPLAATVDLTWLQELAWRTDSPTNVADIITSLGYEGHAIDEDSVEEFGEHALDPPTLDTACDADAQNLAEWTVHHGKQPRQRCSRLTFQLRENTSETIRQTVLSRRLADMVHLSGLPTNAPEGADRFHIEGREHRLSFAGHRVTWFTGPVFGDIAGVPQPYPLVDESWVTDTTLIPF